jgi:UDP-N-acetylmuramoylalanine--D-glutamate ligase
MSGRYLVAGTGVAGAACVRALTARGRDVIAVNAVANASTAALEADGVRVVIAEAVPQDLVDECDDIVVSPGFAPHLPFVKHALATGHDVYSEPELAWRLRAEGAPAWLAITGTNGKTTTTTMLAAILAAAGLRTAAVGNIGEPLVSDSIVEPGTYDALAVELSSFQLHWSSTMAPPVGVLLNLADDHLEWHETFDAYAAAKFQVWRAVDGPADASVARDERRQRPARNIAIGNADDARVAEALSRVDGATVTFTLGDPEPGQYGVRDGWLVDHVTPAGPHPIIAADAIRPAGAHNVANALAAAAAAGAYGIPIPAIRAGLAGYQPEPHRNAPVATVSGVLYVDDSKATNPHAAAASLDAYPAIVWVAGGQLKGVDVDELVARFAARMRGAVLIGVDRAEIAAALARHAPQLPVVDIASTDDGAMAEAVRAAAALAQAGDTVLLAPAAASKDMFSSYAHRGHAFADAVTELAAATGQPPAAS